MEITIPFCRQIVPAQNPLGTSPANKNQENGRNRLVAYARRWPECCREVDDDVWGCKTFEIDKGRFCFRLTAIYSEERRGAARKFARGHNTAERLVYI